MRGEDDDDEKLNNLAKNFKPPQFHPLEMPHAVCADCGYMHPPLKPGEVCRVVRYTNEPQSQPITNTKIQNLDSKLLKEIQDSMLEDNDGQLKVMLSTTMKAWRIIKSKQIQQKEKEL